MVDTLEDVEPPYRSGDSDKVQRDPKWPSVGDATGRINVIIDTMKEDGVGVAARDLIVLMRELGRVTAYNVKLEADALRLFPYSEKLAMLEEENRRLKEALKDK